MALLTPLLEQLLALNHQLDMNLYLGSELLLIKPQLVELNLKL